MSILGVIVRTRAEHATEVRAQLAALPGLDVAAGDGGRWVVVIEDTDHGSAAETMARVTQLPRVLNTSLVYEYSGPDAPAPDAGHHDYRAWRRSATPSSDDEGQA
jgi:periplasmic nitrate reductase NapD